MLNKKAQVGETITWIVATLIIIVILYFSIFIANFYVGSSKKVGVSSVDYVAWKSMTSYVLFDKDGKKVYNQLLEDGNLNEFNGNLGLNIFDKLYGKDYSAIWLGVDSEHNDYFGWRIYTREIGGDFHFTHVYVIINTFMLNKDKELNLALQIKNE